MFIVVLLLSAAVAVQGADQFDLICTGTERSWGADQVVRVSDQTSRARIDLERNLWCWDSCASPIAISKVDAAQIILMDRKAPGGNAGRITVNRITGSYFNNIVVREGFHYESVVTGSCKVAPYTPIPRAAF